MKTRNIAAILLSGLLFFASPGKTQEKSIYVPVEVWSVPKNNDYADEASEFSNQRKKESENFVLYWAKEYGTDPAANSNPKLRFNTAEALAELEIFYRYYADVLKFVEKGKSRTDQYKMLVYVLGMKKGESAYGGGTEDRIGILWSPASRMNSKPYGALAHELGHSFQYMVHADGAWGFTSNTPGSLGQAIYEMTSQFMLLQVYPEWMTFENYHLKNFMEKTHLAFLHEDNRYSSPYVLEYWAYKHGLDFIGRLWRNAKAGEDAVTAYKRLTGINQQQFNDEIFDAARRFITWDIPLMEANAKPYANQHKTQLDSLPDGRFRIAERNCPQNYGYNGIRLEVPPGGTRVSVDFKGVAGSPGFRAIQTGNAGWRYGFVAYKEDGNRDYSPVFSKSDGMASYIVPEHTKYLWLVVSAAPAVHWEHLFDEKKENDEQWPYEIKLNHTKLYASNQNIF